MKYDASTYVAILLPKADVVLINGTIVDSSDLDAAHCEGGDRFHSLNCDPGNVIVVCKVVRAFAKRQVSASVGYDTVGVEIEEVL